MPLLGSTTLIVLAVTAAVTLLVGWRRPFVMLAVLVLGVPFRDFVTRWLNVNTDLGVQTVTALGRWWFALVLALLLLAAIRFLRGRQQFLDRLELGWPDWLFLAAAGVACVAVLFSPNKSAALLSLRGYLQPMAVYVLARVFLPSRREMQWLLVGLLVVGAVMAGFGLWQGLMWEEADFRAAGYVRQDGNLVTPPTGILGQRYIRPASTVSGPNELGLDMVILFSASMFMGIRSSGKLRWLGFGLALVFTGGLVSTFSRSSFLGYVAAWLALGWLARTWFQKGYLEAPKRRRQRLSLGLGGLVIVVVIGFVVSGFADYLVRTIDGVTQTYHFVDTAEAVGYLFRNPQGAGMGMVEPKGALALIEAGGTYHVEGSLLQIAVEMSVLGLAVWLVFWGAALTRVARNWSRVEDPLLKIFSGTAFAGWIASLVAFVFLPLMQSISLMVWLWFLLGIGVSADQIEATWEKAQPRSARRIKTKAQRLPG